MLMVQTLEKTVSVLLVNQYEPMRRLVRLIVEERRSYQIVAEADDGPEAIRMAKGVRPDVILLDLSLPTMNGFEVAKVILRDVPDSRIIFVSDNRRAEVVREAFRIGASGYLVKSQAARELLTAIQSVMDGHPFISVGVTE